MYFSIGDLVDNKRLSYADFREMLTKNLIRNIFVPVGKRELKKVNDLDELIERRKAESLEARREPLQNAITYFKDCWISYFRDPMRNKRKELAEKEFYFPEDRTDEWQKYAAQWLKHARTNDNLILAKNRIQNEKDHYKREKARIEANIESNTIHSICVYRLEYEQAVNALVSARLTKEPERTKKTGCQNGKA